MKKTKKAPKQNAKVRMIGCLWKYDETHDKWDTECGRAFCFQDETRPKSHGYRYCPFCGGLIV